MATFSTTAEFEKSYETLHATFDSGKTKDLRWRKWQLKQFYWMIEDNEDAFVEAMKKDLNRNSFEAVAYDINDTKRAALELLHNIDKWAKDEAPAGAGFVMGYLGGARLRKEPLGVALVIGAWNFPLVTLLQPALAAVAAGNAVLVKPSESAPACQDLLAHLVPKYLDPAAVGIVTGGPAEMTHILTFKFNHIFYTGGGRVGRIIAAAAAKHLTPIVLELGGQAPAIVTATADIDLSARRIAAAKLNNSGQICLNVNHVFVDPAVHDELVRKMGEYIAAWIKDDSSFLATIITPAHWARIKGLLERSAGTATYTGPHDEKKKFIHPTIVTDVQMSDALLSEELFAPLVPVVKADLETALVHINALPHALGMYIFSSSQKEIDRILDNTNSGGVTINDVFIHAGVPGAPFGGVGESGHGNYHGKWGFDTFSHVRSVVGLPTWLDRFMAWRYGKPDVKNRKYNDVKANFKRGETLEDQSAGSKRFSGLW